MTCAIHTAENGQPFHIAQTHEISPNCGMPETHWSIERNQCVADDDFLTAVESEWIEEQIDQPKIIKV